MNAKRGYIAVPHHLYKDLNDKTIKSSTLNVWMRLQELGSHGDWFCVRDEEILKDVNCKRIIPLLDFFARKNT